MYYLLCCILFALYVHESAVDRFKSTNTIMPGYLTHMFIIMSLVHVYVVKYFVQGYFYCVNK